MSRFFEYRGQVRNLRQIARDLGVPYSRLYSRIEAGWTIEAAIETPQMNRSHTPASWAQTVFSRGLRRRRRREAADARE